MNLFVKVNWGAEIEENLVTFFLFFLFFGRMDEVDCFSFSIHASRRESISTLNFCIIPRVRRNEKNE